MDEVDKKEILLTYISILWNGMFGYLPVYICLMILYYTIGWEPGHITALILIATSVIIGLYFRLGDKFFDMRGYFEQ